MSYQDAGQALLNKYGRQTKEKQREGAGPVYRAKQDQEKAPPSQGGAGGGSSAASSPAGMPYRAEAQQPSPQEIEMYWEQMEHTISPEAIYQMLVNAENNRDKKKQKLRAYSQRFYTPVDSSGRRLTYQEVGSSRAAPTGRSYLENQTLGDLAGGKGKTYIQGLQEEKKALDEARREADRVIYGLDMYE